MISIWKREIHGWRTRGISHRCIEELIIRYIGAHAQDKKLIWVTSREIADYFNLQERTDRTAIGLFLRTNLNLIFKGGRIRVTDRKITWEPGKVIRYQITLRSR